MSSRSTRGWAAEVFPPSVYSHATEVMSIAMACGFNHMGRFSTMYRQRFGESPSTTLRRCSAN
jgi:transcriptional regulator GlxA family with amidase domain